LRVGRRVHFCPITGTILNRIAVRLALLGMTIAGTNPCRPRPIETVF
jgi:hypothetical protein